MFIKVSTHPLISPYGAFCMADTNYKINEIFFNSNTVYAFFVFMLVSSIAKSLNTWLHVHHANIAQTVKTCYKIKINYRESKSCFYGFSLHKSHP